MASFSIFSSSTTPQTLLNGEAGFIGQNGSLVTVSSSVSASGSSGVTVLGSLYSFTEKAVDHAGESLTVQIGKDGTIGTQYLDTIFSEMSLSAFVTNDGLITSGEDGLDLRASDTEATITVLNSGTIMGISDAIVTDSGTDSTFIVNLGELIGGSGGIDLLGGTSTIENFGSIVGASYGIDGTDNVDKVVNSGTISGGVALGSGDDMVINRGTIDVVILGVGDDAFDGRGGTVTDVVQGGAGDDLYTISQSDIRLVEGLGQGTDSVRSKVNYALEANFESLTLIGNKDLRAVGNSTDNTLTGNSGDNVLRGLNGVDNMYGEGGDDRMFGGRKNDIMNGGLGDDMLRGGKGNDRLFGGEGEDRLIGGIGRDRLTGGDNADTFVFGRIKHSLNDANADIILDFEQDLDVIDLSKLLAGSFDFIGAAPLSGTGPEVATSVSGSDTNVLIDVDGDGSADMKIIIDGVTGIQAGDFIL